MMFAVILAVVVSLGRCWLRL